MAFVTTLSSKHPYKLYCISVILLNLRSFRLMRRRKLLWKKKVKRISQEIKSCALTFWEASAQQHLPSYVSLCEQDSWGLRISSGGYRKRDWAWLEWGLNPCSLWRSNRLVNHTSLFLGLIPTCRLKDERTSSASEGRWFKWLIIY